MAEFESADIPLSSLCEEHFGMELPRATRLAAAHKLPVPFYKKAGKSGYFCSVIDWAKYLENQAAKARIEWQKINARVI